MKPKLSILNAAIKKQMKRVAEENHRLGKLRDMLFRLRDLPKLEARVGKCYKSRNGYGGGDMWWLYARVVGVSGRYNTAVRFQTTSDRRTTVEFDTLFSNDSFVEIPRAEYDDAWEDTMMSITEIAP